MDVLFVILSLLFGFIFIVSQYYTVLPAKNSYHGVICDIDQDSQTVMVQYEKKGEKRKAAFCFGSLFSDSVLSVNFSGRIGLEVNIILDANEKIEFLTIPKSKKEKRKISWGILLIGLLMFGYGLYKGILIITSLGK